MRILTPNAENIEEAATTIKNGGLIGMPTETVYGLAANACDSAAIAKIFEAKGRPAFNPLISHFADAKDIEAYAIMDARAKALATAFWPAPLTMILPKREGTKLSDLVTAGLDTIAVRVPANLTARQLIKAANVPLAAPSANKSGTLSPTSPKHVADSLGEAVDIILADGSCQIGLESTVIDLSTDKAYILRPGAITAEDIAHVLGNKISYAHPDTNAEIKSPGQLLKHYAPNTPVRLNAIDLEEGEALLAFGSDKFMGVKTSNMPAHQLPQTQRCNLSETSDLHEAAANLFAMLKELDRPEHSAIAVMSIPDTGLGIAINDRLKRAAN